MADPPKDPTKVHQLWTDAQIAEAVVKCRGLLSLAAKMLGMSRRNISYRIAASEELQDVVQDARELSIDLAEMKLIEAAGKGEDWAVMFFLKTQGKARGYVEKTETQVGGALGVVGATMQQVLEHFATNEHFAELCRESGESGHARLRGDGVQPGPVENGPALEDDRSTPDAGDERDGPANHHDRGPAPTWQD